MCSTEYTRADYDAKGCMEYRGRYFFWNDRYNGKWSTACDSKDQLEKSKSKVHATFDARNVCLNLFRAEHPSPPSHLLSWSAEPKLQSANRRL